MLPIKQLIKKGLSNIFWTFYGQFISNPQLPGNVGSLMFVCKGNVCRSPFAERYTRKRLAIKGVMNVFVTSTGIDVTKAFPAPENALSAGKLLGIDMSDHLSKKITLKAVEQTDMILSMEFGQMKKLRELFPKYSHKIFLLPLFDRSRNDRQCKYSAYNIGDPYNGDVNSFYDCYKRIEKKIDKLIQSLT